MPEQPFLNKELKTIASLIDKGETVNKKVSMASVKWHLQHTLMVINKVIPAVVASDPKTFKSKFNLKRSILFTLNKIPRGKGKAPEQVRPDGDISKESIETHLATARENLAQLDTLDKNAYFQHFLFGDLNIKNTKRFLVLHTNHHLKIINDILNR